MKLPLQITFRDIPPSDAVESRIREKAAKLDELYEHIMSCRVVVEAPHRRHHQGKLYHVRIDITVPDDELVVSREPHERHAHEDVYVAIRDAFDAAKRQLEDYVRRHRSYVKTHEAQPYGRVLRLFPEQGYGFIESADGREIYFHRNAVLDGAFERLRVAAEVRFVEEHGEQGPQASTVWLVGKHHVVGP